VFGWPAIFLAGGALPLALAPFLATQLPASIAATEPCSRNPVSSLFQRGLAPSTSLIWAINLFSLLAGDSARRGLEVVGGGFRGDRLPVRRACSRLSDGARH
jgi:hypothetical protein